MLDTAEARRSSSVVSSRRIALVAADGCSGGRALADIDSKDRSQIPAKNGVFLAGAQEAAVTADVVQTLRVGTEPFNIRHIRAPDQLGSTKQIAHSAH